MPFGKINNYDEILDIDVTKDSTGGSLFFITEENCLYKIVPSGTSYKLTTIVNRIYCGNDTGKLNKKDHFDLPYGMATAKNGDVYFFNQSWYTMHHMHFTSTAPYAGVVKTFVGKPAATKGGDTWPFKDGTGENATFNSAVWDMCADGKGNFYVADYRDDLVRKVSSTGVVNLCFNMKMVWELMLTDLYLKRRQTKLIMYLQRKMAVQFILQRMADMVIIHQLCVL